ncbi:hypothetical protein MIND_00710700 [Mycena indigotica]|uniref:Uncharacterized protein n=1 Tax=Mycena indigotica TaxID=2126181 RepID=A0A8H6W0X8_9AGAR|nr:uncharacterized protein MIND_00710700 [Mycena indigotica]KAF7301454.1 hypothetical protein MIND_00710700 [Mycena indigotica]
MILPTILRRVAAPRTRLHIHRRTLFGIGEKPEPPTPQLGPRFEDTARQAQQLFADKPEAVEAIVKFAKVMEESGVAVTAGKMPGPMQLLKLAKNPKFHEAYREVESELGKAGIDVKSKEFMDVATSLYKNYQK